MKLRLFYSFIKNIKFKTLRKRQIHVYRNGYLKVDQSARLRINECFLFLNKCHFPNSFKPLPGAIWIEKNGSFSLQSDHYTLCEGARIHVRENAKLMIDGKGMLNTLSEIDVYEHISIGYGTIISSNCYITDSDQHDVVQNGTIKPRTKPVKIGKNVWVGRNVIILKGVEIGDNAIIGAGSVVTKSVPANTLFTGVYAKQVKENINWRR
jgi:hypothetical protein